MKLRLTVTFLFLVKSDWLGAFRTVYSDAVVVDISDTAAVDEVVGMQFSLSNYFAISAYISTVCYWCLAY